LWGSPYNDHRGTAIEQLIDENKFVVLNNGQPTYTHHTGLQSHIVCHTFGTKSTWKVLHGTLGSDHCLIVTCINISPAEDTDYSQKFIMSKADWESFKTNSRKLLTPDLISGNKSIDENTTALTYAITTAAELSIPQLKNIKRKRLKSLPYWNEHCKKAIQDRNTARNAMLKNKTLDNCINYRRLKGKAQYVIKSSAR